MVRVNFPNSFRIAARIVWEKMFDPFFDHWYKHHKHAPRYAYSDDSWMLEHWEENMYDPICFPLLFNINCVGCFGCSHNHNPHLQPDIHNGPYKVLVTEEFCENYEELAGKDALVELLWDLEKSNMKVDKNIKN